MSREFAGKTAFITGAAHGQGRAAALALAAEGAIRTLVAANSAVRFAGQRRQEVYNWVERTLVRHECAGLGRADKGVPRFYLAQMTGLSRAQVTRLIGGYRKTGPGDRNALSTEPLLQHLHPCRRGSAGLRHRAGLSGAQSCPQATTTGPKACPTGSVHGGGGGRRVVGGVAVEDQ